MNKLAYHLVTPFVFTALLMTSCGGEEATEESSETETTETVEEVEEEEIVNSFSISENVVGIFEIGASVPEKLPAELSMRQFVEEEDAEGVIIEHTHNVIFNQLEDVVELIMDQGSGEHHEDKVIEEMYVLSNYYETDEAISVGSSVEEFQLAYPDATAWYSSELDMYFVESESVLGAQFMVVSEDVAKPAKGKSDMEEMDFEDFVPEAKIVKIRMY